LGRKLLKADIVNRDLSGGDGTNGRLNPNYNTDFSYRANQGFSSYHAFTFLSRYTPRSEPASPTRSAAQPGAFSATA